MSVQAMPKRNFRPFLKLLKYGAIYKVSYFQNLVYPMDLFTLGLVVAFRAWLFTQLYRVTFSQIHVAEVGGLTLPMTIWLLVIVQSFQLSSSTRITILRLSEDVKNGNIAYVINRPFSFLGYLYSLALGRSSARLLATLAIGLSVSILLVGVVPVTWHAVIAAVLLGVLGLTLNLVISMCIGLLSFWTEDTSAFRWIYDKFQWTFGGMVIPISFFPGILLKLVEYSPFSQIFYASARMLVSYSSGLFWRYLITQIFWLVFIGLIAGLMYKRGIKNISVNGG